MLLARRRHRLPGHGRGHQRQGGPAPAALRVVAPAAPLRLPRRRARAAAPAVDRPGVPRLAGPDASSGGRPGPPRPARCWSGGSALPLWRNLRHRLRVDLGRPRGPTASCRSTSPAATWTASGSRPASSSPGASSAGRAGPAPTRTRCRPRPTAAACGSPCRTSATAARAVARLRPGHPRPGRGPVRPAQRPGPHPAQGRADRRRRRHHPAAGAGRGTGLRARARRCCCSATPTEPLFAGELAALAAERGLQVLRPARHRRAPGSWLGDGVGRRRPHRAALLGPRHRRARRLRLRPGAVDRRWSAARSPPPACPPTASTSRPSVVTTMRRIVLWLLAPSRSWCCCSATTPRTLGTAPATRAGRRSAPSLGHDQHDDHVRRHRPAAQPVAGARP